MPKAHRIIPPLTDKDISRFCAKVDRTFPLLCWEWKPCRNQGGYGKFSLGGRCGWVFQAHRVAWVIANGPIPEGMCVCHRCDNPACVNFSHLFLATHDGNTKDMIRKGRLLVGTKHPNAQLTEVEVREMRTRYTSTGITQSQLAAEYGISQRNVSDIVSGKAWRHLLPQP